MPTDNPKISGYVPQQLYDRFKEYQQENDLSMSQAVILILAEYFGIEETIKNNTSGSLAGGVTLSAFQDLVERVEYLESTLGITPNKVNNVDNQNTDQNKASFDDVDSSNLLFSFSVESQVKKIELMGKHFAKRINVSPPILSSSKKKKTINEFTEWTTQQDPDNISWTYKNSSKPNIVLYCPIEDTNSELLSKLQEWITKNINQ